MTPTQALAFWSAVVLLSLCVWGLLWVLCVARGRVSRMEEYEAEKAGLLDALRKHGRAPYTIWITSCSWCRAEIRRERRPFEPDLGVEVQNHGICDRCLDETKRGDIIDAIAADAIAQASSGEVR